MKPIFLSLVVALSLVWTASGQQTLELLFDTTDNPGEGPLPVSTVSQPRAPTIFQFGVKLCIQGVWAFYNKENYGRDNVNDMDLTVNTVRGFDPEDCATDAGVRAIISSTRSVRSLGPMNPGDPFIQMFRLRHFLTRMESQIVNIGDVLGPNLDLTIPYKSLVVNDPSDRYLICGQVLTNCICVTRVLVVRDLDLYPAANPLRRIRSFDQVGLDANLAARCDTFTQPAQ